MAKAIATGILPAMYGRAIGTLGLKDSGISRKVCKDEHLMAFELEFMENFKGNFTVTKGKDTLILDNQKMKIYLKTP